jgi:hypothetical protein
MVMPKIVSVTKEQIHSAVASGGDPATAEGRLHTIEEVVGKVPIVKREPNEPVLVTLPRRHWVMVETHNRDEMAFCYVDDNAVTALPPAKGVWEW